MRFVSDNRLNNFEFHNFSLFGLSHANYRNRLRRDGPRNDFGDAIVRHEAARRSNDACRNSHGNRSVRHRRNAAGEVRRLEQRCLAGEQVRTKHTNSHILLCLLKNSCNFISRSSALAPEQNGVDGAAEPDPHHRGDVQISRRQIHIGAGRGLRRYGEECNMPFN